MKKILAMIVAAALFISMGAAVYAEEGGLQAESGETAAAASVGQDQGSGQEELEETLNTPAEPEKTPATPEETLSEPEETPAEPEETPAEPEETPTTPVETPAESEKTPTESEESPATSEETPAAQAKIFKAPANSGPIVMGYDYTVDIPATCQLTYGSTDYQDIGSVEVSADMGTWNDITYAYGGVTVTVSWDGTLKNSNGKTLAYTLGGENGKDVYSGNSHDFAFTENGASVSLQMQVPSWDGAEKNTRYSTTLTYTSQLGTNSGY